ncbi:MAG TPA: hypothetical protein VEN82_07270, partial [Actinomycetota bacterium]|nr:hypothetical protein [Actinomycetota bacterium]
TNNTRATIPAGLNGYYELGAVVHYAAAAGGSRRDCNIRLNGVTTLVQTRVPPGAAGESRTMAATMAQLNVGDYIELGGNQDTGAGVNALGGTIADTHLWLILIGA